MNIPDAVWVALIVAIVGPCVLFALGRIFPAKGDVAALWKDWSKEQTDRIVALEEDVAELKTALAEEQSTNKALQGKNDRLSAMLTDLIRWAILLRDEVIRLGGNVPPAPSAVESALTNLEP